ncbi:hypothetical protein ACF1AE_25675 [Streptomyces sp. NPDC014986]|uniref:hypothetical protein n=1 Tax=Streptomyces sp. NPDC014986 TaxID=3364934 RepID=UPI0036F67216
MALINPPTWMQAGSYPARSDRLALAALLSYPGFAVDESTPMRIRQGVKPSYQNYQLKVRAAPTPNMTVIVSAGFAFIDQHDTGGQGTYICANDGDVTLTVQPAGGAGQYRKDTVVASVYDAEYAGSANEWRLEIIQGPYAASAGAAVRGSLPPNAQVLADLSIGPSQTSIAAANIVDLRNYSVAAGGIVPVASNIAPNRPHPGQVMYLTDTDTFVYGKANGTVATLLQSAGASEIGKRQFVRLDADFTRQSTTLADVPGLMLTVAADAIYTVEGLLHWYTTDEANSDLNLDWVAPVGATGTWLGFAQPISANSGEGVVRTISTALTAARSYGARADADNPSGMVFRALVRTGSTAGTYGPQIARTAGTGTITLCRDSWLKAERVA